MVLVLSGPDAEILRLLRKNPSCKLSSSEVARKARLSSYELYTALARLETAGMIKSEWETPERLSRSRRRLYFSAPVDSN